MVLEFLDRFEAVVIGGVFQSYDPTGKAVSHYLRKQIHFSFRSQPSEIGSRSGFLVSLLFTHIL